MATEGLTEPIFASRTERTILHNMRQGAAVAEAGRVDIGDLGRRARHLLAATTVPDDND